MDLKEIYVSYELAKLLNEKGFNVPTEMVWYECFPSSIAVNKKEIGTRKLDYFYWDEITEHNFVYSNDTNENGMPDYIKGHVYSAPIHQVVNKWLREQYKIFIEQKVQLIGYTDIEYTFTIWYYDDFSETMDLAYNSNSTYKKYEESIEEAFIYCLKNLVPDYER